VGVAANICEYRRSPPSSAALANLRALSRGFFESYSHLPGVPGGTDHYSDLRAGVILVAAPRYPECVFERDGTPRRRLLGTAGSPRSARFTWTIVQ
jgi:hypothetical protein